MKRLRLTALVLLLCIAPAWAQTPEEKKAAVAYVQGLQQPDGGFVATTATPTAAKPLSSLRATSSALRAAKYNGGDVKDREAAAKFVQAAFDPVSGGFVDVVGGKPDVTTTAVGLMAVVELKLPGEKYTDAAVKYLTENAKSFEDIRIAAAGLEAVSQRPPQADAWLEQVAKLRNPDATWGKGDGVARETGSAAVVVLRLGGKLDHKEEVLKALKAGQRDDGGFGKEGAKGSDQETTYRVMRAFSMLKEKPADVEKLRAFLGKCRNADGGCGVAPGQPSSVSGTYYSAIILHWLAEK